MSCLCYDYVFMSLKMSDLDYTDLYLCKVATHGIPKEGNVFALSFSLRFKCTKLYVLDLVCHKFRPAKPENFSAD